MLLDTLRNYRIYLASQSPRRRDLLKGMGIGFEVVETHVSEDYDPGMAPEEIVCHLSRLKLSPLDVSARPSGTLFIACDTIVASGGRVLGKPKGAEEAKAMLRSLSGHAHTVFSGVTVATPGRMLTDYRTSEVRFARLEEPEIEYYVQQYMPFDKAGAYGVQEWIGYVGIERIEGSVYNVMGLPTQLLWNMLGAIVR